MRGHEFAGVGEGGEEGEFAAEDGGGTDDGEAAGVLPRIARFGAAEEFHVVLHKRQVLPVADGADDDVGQRAGEIQIGTGGAPSGRPIFG